MVVFLTFVYLATTGVAVRIGLDGVPPNFEGFGVADKTQAKFASAGEKAAALPPAAPADALMETNMSALEQLQDAISQKQLEELIQKMNPPRVQYVRNAIFADLQWKTPPIYPDIPQVLGKFKDIITDHLNRPVNVMQASASYFQGQKSVTITPSKGYSQTLVPGAFLVEEEGPNGPPPNGKNLNYYAVENDGSDCPKHLIPWLSQEGMRTLTRGKGSFKKLYEKQAIAVIKYKDAKKITDYVKDHLGAVDNAKYKNGLDDAHWKNGAIAIQFNEDMPDFYPIDGDTYSNKYTKISEATFAQKNPELLKKLSLEILGDQTSNSWEYLWKTGRTSMYKLSDLGRVACKDPISKPDGLRIESPWGGTQDKKVGVHAFLVEEDGPQFYMVNGDSKDRPLYYKLVA